MSKDLLLISHLALSKLKSCREGDETARMNKFKKIMAKTLTAALLLQLIINTASAAQAVVPAEEKSKEMSLMVGGFPFGARFFTGGITVVGFSEVETDSENKSPAYNAGMRENDFITAVNGIAIESAEIFISKVEESKGLPLAMDFKRNGKIFSVSVTPVISKDDGKYKTGMWIKDSTAGIGTVTFIVPDTKMFGGLGHSIYDSENGQSASIKGGYITEVAIDSVKQGTQGEPGELKGTFSKEKIGSLKQNSKVGVFGFFTTLPSITKQCNTVNVATPDEVKTGPAKIRCTVSSDGIREYDVSIEEKSMDEPTNKNFVIEITDENLIAKTGGIVQGMSGSPIIQDGKLIGAITHVLISEPKKGYGIYIGNMLSQMSKVA